MIGLLAHTQMFLAIQNAISDPYIDKVVSLMPFRGLDGSTVFVDRMGKVWTASGTPKISSTQKQFTGTSGEFTNTTSDILTSTHADYVLGTADFTIECFTYMKAVAGVNGQAIFAFGSNLVYYTSGGLAFFNGSANAISGGAYVEGVWKHIALVRAAGVLSLYLGGVKLGGIAYTVNVVSTTIAIGKYNTNNPLNGYIDDFRITKGVARYTSNFTPPNKENYLPTDPYIDNVVSLLHFSKYFRDATGAQWEALNGAVISSTQNKFWGSSAYSPGTGGARIHRKDALGTITGDFTVEFWLYYTGVGSVRFFSTYPLGSTSEPNFVIQCQDTSGTQLAIYSNGGNSIIGTVPSILNAWHHVALSRKGSDIKLFLDGAQVGSTYAFSGTYLMSDINLMFNAYSSQSTGGYIQDLRVTKGVARYTANFTPPNYPHPTDDYFENVVSLLRFNDVVGSKVFSSESGSSIPWTANSGATISTAVSKFGGSSLSIDGISGSIVADNPTGAILDANFTVEGWAYVTDLSQPRCFCDTRSAAAAQNAFALAIQANGTVYVYTADDNTIRNSTTIIATNTWFHYAFVRNGTTCTLYVNGNSCLTFTKSISFNTGYWMLGRSIDASGFRFKGYLQDFRVTVGVARYTTNFSVPTGLYPSDNSDIYVNTTPIILHLNGTDGSTNIVNSSTVPAKWIASNGGTAFGTAQTSSTQTIFSDTSLASIGAGCVRSIAHSNFSMGGADFTWEGWFYYTSLNSYQTLICNRDDNGNHADQITVSLDSMRNLGIFASSYLTNNATSILPNTWFHVALSVSASVGKLFLNGTQLGVDFSVPNLVRNRISVAGNLNGTEWLNGFVDEVRITKGIARYTKNFTPPTRPFVL